MNIQEKVFAWAEEYLNLPAGSVSDVDFGIEDDGYSCCSSYSTPGVYVTHSIPLTGRQRKPRTNDAFISLDGSLDNLIKAIVGIE